jgi:MYXO-CTERM domain-containing protein
LSAQVLNLIESLPRDTYHCGVKAVVTAAIFVVAVGAGTTAMAESAPAPYIDLELSMAATADLLAPDDTVDITLTLRNTGSWGSGEEGVTVGVVAPNGLSLVGDVAGFDSVSGHWTTGVLHDGQMTTLTLSYRAEALFAGGVVAAEVIDDHAQSYYGDPDSDPNNQDPCEDDYARVIIESSLPSDGGGIEDPAAACPDSPGPGPGPQPGSEDGGFTDGTKESSSGGCSVRGGESVPWPLLLLFAALLRRNRRRQN